MKSKATIAAALAAAIIAPALHAVPCSVCSSNFDDEYAAANWTVNSQYIYCNNTFNPNSSNPFIVALNQGCKSQADTEYTNDINDAYYNLGYCNATCC